MKYCYKCVVSIAKNNEYIKCFKCNALYCYHCIKSNQFVFDENTLFYKYNCKHCIKISSL